MGRAHGDTIVLEILLAVEAEWNMFGAKQNKRLEEIKGITKSMFFVLAMMLIILMVSSREPKRT